MSISGNLRQQVISAANARCEYCQTSSRVTGTPLVMEHSVLSLSLMLPDSPNLSHDVFIANVISRRLTV